MASAWCKSPSFRPRRAAACCLIVIAGCGHDRIHLGSAEADAAADGATSAGTFDSGGGGRRGSAPEAAADVDGSGLPDASDLDSEAIDAASAAMDSGGDGTMSMAPSDSGGAASGDGLAGEAAGPCSALVDPRPIEGYTHVAVCSPVTYSTKPPSSGDHYPIWAAYRSYINAIPEGFWVHNLEHGAVVVSYNCPGGCAADVAAAQTWIDGLPDDPLCMPDAGDARIRMIMTPDPGLDVKFAASSWGWTLRADCFDPASFEAFVRAHYGQGREAFCGQGQDLSLGVPDGCGE